MYAHIFEIIIHTCMYIHLVFTTVTAQEACMPLENSTTMNKIGIFILKKNSIPLCYTEYREIPNNFSLFGGLCFLQQQFSW